MTVKVGGRGRTDCVGPPWDSRPRLCPWKVPNLSLRPATLSRAKFSVGFAIAVCPLAKQILQSRPAGEALIRYLDYIEFYSGPRASQQLNREFYVSLPVKVSGCIECKECLERCPFDADIIFKMRRAIEVFETTA